MFTPEMTANAESVIRKCRELGLRLATAESCTGGMIAACLTEVAGCSDVIDRGYITYSNKAKIELLDIPRDMIDARGAVSEQVARAMAEGAMQRSGAELAVSVTGIAGPEGGTAQKPVGLVHIACARDGQLTLHRRCTFGDRGRAKVRELSVLNAFELTLLQLENTVQA